MNNALRVLSLAAVYSLIACGGDKGTSADTSSSSTAASSNSGVRTGKTPMTVDAGVPSSCTPASAALIEIVSPAKGTILVPGDTLIIRWKTIVADFQGYLPQVSVDGGKSWALPLDPAVAGSVLADSKGAAAQCLSYTTIIPRDGSYSPGASDNASVLFRVKDYSSTQATMRDVSDSVTVLAP